MKQLLYIRLIMLLTLATGGGQYTLAQQATVQEPNKPTQKSEYRKAWEFGAGVSGLQISRFGVQEFSQNANGNYSVQVNKRDVLFGGQLYAARELNSYLYLDLQGELGYAKDPVRNGKESRWLGTVGTGLQWRFAEYFHSPYIDPFLRAGVGYMYKSFSVAYSGAENFKGEDMNWDFTNSYNKSGADKKHLLPISLGAGVNMWLNDRWGLGLQADYMLMPYKNIANVWQGNVRWMYRLSGK